MAGRDEAEGREGEKTQRGGRRGRKRRMTKGRT